MAKNSKTDVVGITQIALCVAILSACSFIVLPVPFTPVVFSVHTLAVNLAALVLKPSRAVISISVYLVMGLCGLPVFSGGTAGPDKLFGPTGGFYFGFLASVVLVSLLKGKRSGVPKNLILTICLALPVQHFFAVLFMCFYNGFDIGLSFVSVSLPFIALDVVKAVISSLCAPKLSAVLERSKKF